MDQKKGIFQNQQLVFLSVNFTVQDGQIYSVTLY